MTAIPQQVHDLGFITRIKPARLVRRGSLGT